MFIGAAAIKARGRQVLDTPAIPDADYNTFGFDGTDDYITTTYNASGLSSNVTVSAWVYLSSTGSDEGILGEWQSSSGFMLYRVNSTGVRFYINSSFTPTFNINTEEWTLLTGTYEGTTIRLYVNGVEEATTSLSASIGNAPITTEVGRYAGSNGTIFNGSITLPIIWDRTLDSDENLLIYQSGKTPYYETVPPSLFDAEWAIEMSSRDNTLVDLTGNGSDGTANGGITDDGETQTFTSYTL